MIASKALAADDSSKEVLSRSWLRKEELEKKHYAALRAHSIEMAANELAVLKKMADKTQSS
jgi:hypothetical protein